MNTLEDCVNLYDKIKILIKKRKGEIQNMTHLLNSMSFELADEKQWIKIYCQTYCQSYSESQGCPHNRKSQCANLSLGYREQALKRVNQRYNISYSNIYNYLEKKILKLL